MRAQRDELGWVRRALKATSLLAHGPCRRPAEPGEEHELRLASEHWLRDQADFFRSRAGKMEQLDHHYSRLSKLLFTAALLWGLAYLGALAGIGLDLKDGSPWPSISFFSIGSLLLLSGLAHVYVEKSGFPGLANRYLAMADLFALARHRMDDFLAHGDLDSARCLLTELGRDALNEQGDWLLFQRERPLEVPG